MGKELYREHSEVLKVVMNHIGAAWSLEEQESIFFTVQSAIFPSNPERDAWTGRDLTDFTIDGQHYHPVTISIGDRPSI